MDSETLEEGLFFLENSEELKNFSKNRGGPREVFLRS
jgi:hypothetical protein